MVTKELHIYLNYPPESAFTTYVETNNAVETKQEYIETTITYFAQLYLGYKLFIHYNNQMHEIKEGQTEGTNREIKLAHNVEKLLLNGEFDWF